LSGERRSGKNQLGVMEGKEKKEERRRGGGTSCSRREKEKRKETPCVVFGEGGGKRG